MPNKKNIKQVKELTDSLLALEGLVFVDYQSASARDIEQLRNAVEELGGTFHIVKNTLLRIALMRSNILDTAHGIDVLKSPTALLYLHNDIISPIKKLAEFIKANPQVSIKGGIINHELLSAEKITGIAQLPGYEELMAKLLGQIQAPVSGLVRALSGVNRSLVYTLDQIRIAKGGEQ